MVLEEAKSIHFLFGMNYICKTVLESRSIKIGIAVEISDRNILCFPPPNFLSLFRATKEPNVEASLFSSCMSHSTLELT